MSVEQEGKQKGSLKGKDLKNYSNHDYCSMTAVQPKKVIRKSARII
jgi:hypothetical protein